MSDPRHAHACVRISANTEAPSDRPQSAKEEHATHAKAHACLLKTGHMRQLHGGTLQPGLDNAPLGLGEDSGRG